LSLNPTNSQKLTKFKFARLSLVCFFALNGVMSAATIPQHDANNLNIAGGKNNIDRIMWAGGGRHYDYTDKDGWARSGDWTANNGRYPSIFDYAIFDYKYRSMPKINLLFRDNATIKHLSIHYVKEGGGTTPWEDMRVNGLNGSSGSGNRNLTIGTFDVKGDVKFEIKLGGKSTIDTLNNTAERLNIKVNNEDGTDTLTISTLNQTTTGDSQIFKNVTIDTFNLQNGKSYQRGGSVGTLNLQDGEFHLGAKDDMSQAEHDGVVDNLVLQNGTFKQYKGEINNITLTSDKETASFTANNDFKDGSKGTYDGLISKVDKQVSGENTVTFGNNGGTITTTLTSGQLTIDNKKGDITNNGAVSSLDVSQKQGSAIVYNSNGASIDKLTSNNDSTIHNQGKISDLDFSGGSVNNHNGGEITKLDLKGGSLNNAGTITTLNNTNGTAINNSGTMQAITNNGTTGTLTLTNSGGTIDKITNGNGATATIRNQGKITNGIINDGGT
ncbi:hypothetical protein A9748_08455, partial [Campylobacter upsaliensis]|nr:hypothetical protein [Campylobacter upsaliensis]